MHLTLFTVTKEILADNQSDQGRMVLLIAGPPVEVGVTMYVLSISSVSEVLMVQFAFKLIQTHIRRSIRFFFSSVNPNQPLSIQPSSRYRRRSSPILSINTVIRLSSEKRSFLYDPILPRVSTLHKKGTPTHTYTNTSRARKH